MMGRFLAMLLAVVLVVSSASVFAAPHGHLRKTVYVNVGGAAEGAGGGEAVAVAKPVPYPVPVPVPVEVPVAVPVEKPVYVESKPVVPVQGGGQAQGAVYGTVHLNSGNFFDSIFNIPISVLRSVNQFLNNSVRGSATLHVGAVKHGYGGFAAQPVHQVPVHPAAGAGSSSSAQSSAQSAAESSAQSSAQSAADSSASSSAQSSSSSSAGAAGGAVLYDNKSPNFNNDIFKGF